MTSMACQIYSCYLSFSNFWLDPHWDWWAGIWVGSLPQARRWLHPQTLRVVNRPHARRVNMRSGSSAGSSATSLLLSITESLWKLPNYFSPDRDLCSHPSENVYPGASVFKPSTETQVFSTFSILLSHSPLAALRAKSSPLLIFSGNPAGSSVVFDLRTKALHPSSLFDLLVMEREREIKNFN